MNEVKIASLNTPFCLDRDGNSYKSVQIGNQIWMAENLKTTKYNDGTAIAFVDDEDADVEVWEDLATGAYSQGGTGTTADDDYEDTYGYLYNGYAVDTGKLAPEGWHVPTDTELTTLTDYLGSDAGSKLAGRADLWLDGDLENNAEFGTSGFNLLPGGARRYFNGNYLGMGGYGYFWSSTENGSSNAWNRLLHYAQTSSSRGSYYKRNGYSVRCIKSPDKLTEVDMISEAMSGVSITIPNIPTNSEKWDTLSKYWDKSVLYWNSSYNELVTPVIP